MGRIVDFAPEKLITEGDLPAIVTLDPEASAIAAAAATAAINTHLAASHPHSQYFRQLDGDARYHQKSASFFTAAPFPTANSGGNSVAISWNDIQSGLGVAELCNFSGTGSGDAFAFYRMAGNPIAKPTISHRVCFININGGFVTTSDFRLKSDFSPAPGIEILMQLNPLRYLHWTCEGFDKLHQTLKRGKSFTKKLGFIAQEVQRVLPEAVSIPLTNSEPWGIDYNCFFPIVIRSVQQQQQQISELQAEIIELRTQVHSLLASR
jgi:hypothetical protein